MFLLLTGILLCVLQIHGRSDFDGFVKCETTNDSDDPRQNFETQCDAMCSGNCMQPTNFDLKNGNGMNQLFCDCPDACTQVTPVDGQGDLYSKKISDCSQICTQAGQDGGFQLCVVSVTDDGNKEKELIESLCVCRTRGQAKEKKYCSKKYKRACTNICREADTCHNRKLKFQYCDCEHTVPRKQGDQYNCDGSPPAQISRRSTKLCRQQCESDDRDIFYCERIAKGPLTGVPRHVCACG